MKKKKKLISLDAGFLTPPEMIDFLNKNKVKYSFSDTINMTKEDLFLKKIFGEEDSDTFDIFKQCDEWCRNEVLNHPKAKLWTQQEYPFKDYTYIDPLLRKHAKEFVEEMFQKCPIKGKKIYHLYDAIALVIFNNKLDPWCFTKSNRQSMWDKLSEEGQV